MRKAPDYVRTATHKRAGLRTTATLREPGKSLSLGDSLSVSDRMMIAIFYFRFNAAFGTVAFLTARILRAIVELQVRLEKKHVKHDRYISIR